jgi:hypothetical protein
VVAAASVLALKPAALELNPAVLVKGSAAGLVVLSIGRWDKRQGAAQGRRKIRHRDVVSPLRHNRRAAADGWARRSTLEDRRSRHPEVARAPVCRMRRPLI